MSIIDRGSHTSSLTNPPQCEPSLTADDGASTWRSQKESPVSDGLTESTASQHPTWKYVHLAFSVVCAGITNRRQPARTLPTPSTKGAFSQAQIGSPRQRRPRDSNHSAVALVDTGSSCYYRQRALHRAAFGFNIYPSSVRAVDIGDGSTTPTSYCRTSRR